MLEASDSPLAVSGLVRSRDTLQDMICFGGYYHPDESSQLVAPTLDLQGDEQVLDACAAPGGKQSIWPLTSHLVR